MTIQFPANGSHFYATSRNILREHGIEITIGSDFEEYQRIIELDRPMQTLGAPFDPSIHSLNDKTAFWLTGRSHDGSLVHTQAVKRVPMRSKTLAGYLLRNFREYPPALPDLDLARSRYRATPGAHRIDGAVVYLGEVWMAPSPLYRGMGLSTVLARTGLMEARRKWDPDWLFGLMARTVAFKGFAERMGYMHNEPGAVRWYRHGSDQPLEGFLSYLGRDDLAFLLEMPVADLVAEAA